jgi:hypothetical protein
MVNADAKPGRRVVYRPYPESLHLEYGEIVRVTDIGWIIVKYDDGRTFQTDPERLEWA